MPWGFGSGADGGRDVGGGHRKAFEQLALLREAERMRAAQEERERARRKMQQRMDDERQALNEARKNRGLPTLRDIYGAPRMTDPFRKMDAERERDRKMRARRKLEEERAAAREREARRRAEEERLAAEAEAAAAGPLPSSKPKRRPVIGPEDTLEERSKKPQKTKEEPRKRRQKPKIKKNSPTNEEEAEEEEKAKGKEDKGSYPLPQKKISIASFVDKNEPTLANISSRGATKKNISEEEEEESEKGIEADAEADSEVPLPDPPKKVAKRKKPIISSQEEKPKEDEKRKGICSFARQLTSNGEVLEKYDLGKTIGDGNFAVVKAAKEKSSGKDAAVKIVDKAKLRGRDFMMDNEVGIMLRCSHPNIVQLREQFETPKEIYLVMDLVKVLLPRTFSRRFDAVVTVVTL